MSENEKIQNIDSSDVTRYEKFAFPRFRDLLRKEQQVSIVAGAASCYGYPAGLVLAEAMGGGQTGIIHSLFVAPRFRNLGFGKELLFFAERKLREKGCTKSEICFVDDGNSTSAIKSTLSKCGWGEPELMREISKIDIFSLSKENWPHRYHLPAAYTIIPWPDVLPAKLEELKAPEHKWYPGYASPFKDQPVSPHFSTSFWLCLREEIVGWVITRLTAPDTLYYDILFVREDLQKTGRGVQLLAEALKAQFREQIPFGTHIVMHAAGFSNPPLIRFSERRLKPFALRTEKYWNSYK